MDDIISEFTAKTGVLSLKEYILRSAIPDEPEYEDWDLSESAELNEEAEKDGKKVKLNKPFRTPGGPKKFAVYVKNPAGKVIIVRFGDPGLSIKTSNDERRKNFRARHNCDQAHDKTSPRWWSCKMWSSRTAVQDNL